MSTVVLEPAALELAEAFSKPPFLYEMEPSAASSPVASVIMVCETAP